MSKKKLRKDKVRDKQARLAELNRRTELKIAESKCPPCGECQACCEAIGVHELNKPIWTSCEHQIPAGCGIYGSHPDSCKKYWCLYRGGFFKLQEQYRPDKLGVIFDMRTSQPENVFSAWELWENAIEDPKTIDLLHFMSQKWIIIVRRYKSEMRRMFGPAEALEKIKNLVEY